MFLAFVTKKTWLFNKKKKKKHPHIPRAGHPVNINNSLVALKALNTLLNFVLSRTLLTLDLTLWFPNCKVKCKQFCQEQSFYFDNTVKFSDASQRAPVSLQVCRPIKTRQGRSRLLNANSCSGCCRRWQRTRSEPLLYVKGSVPRCKRTHLLVRRSLGCWIPHYP